VVELIHTLNWLVYIS